MVYEERLPARQPLLSLARIEAVISRVKSGHITYPLQKRVRVRLTQSCESAIITGLGGVRRPCCDVVSPLFYTFELPVMDIPVPESATRVLAGSVMTAGIALRPRRQCATP
jgi:hypothetical protein